MHAAVSCCRDYAAHDLPKLPPSIRDWCLEQLSSASAPVEDSRIIIDVALLSFLVHHARFFPPLSLRQPLPRLGLFGIPPKLLRRFLRGCVVATAHGLVIAPASVFVDARKKTILRNRIFARVMSGTVMREEGRMQAAATAYNFGKRGVFDAVASGNVAGVLSYLIADANCVNERDG